MSARLEIETAFGPIWLWGDDTGQPVLLIIHGAFAAFESVGKAVLEKYDVFETHLPGNHCPFLVSASVGVAAAALDQALKRQFGSRGMIVVGFSTGALVALALHAPSIHALVLVEPPLRPHLAWPLLHLREQGPEWGRAFVWEVFGIGPDRVETRDYSHLLQNIRRPAIALVGAVPLLPQRRLKSMPSLVDDTSRAELAAHPLIELREVPDAGHNIARDGRNFLDWAVVRVIETFEKNAGA